MRSYFAEFALLPSGMAECVRLDVADDATLASVSPGVDPAGLERLGGVAVPGLANVHSHAFQRAMAGLAERAGPDGDNFWTWREAMYRFLAVLTPEDVEAVAAQLYLECLRHGYTSVGEFHYLHTAPDGTPYADPAEMSRRLVVAAEAVGIGMRLLPVLYRHGGFGGAPVTPSQRRFLLSPDAFARLCSTMAGVVPTGAAPHSLRAAAPEDIAVCVAVSDSLGPDTPIHIHAAEQVKEVADCLAWSGARPVEWLLANAPVDPRWCLIHATHMTADETARLAASGAVAGLCPTTEANLGDGIFPLRPFLDAGGRFGVGSDSNVGTSPVEELRWLEYVRRLESRARNVSESRRGASVGAGLITRAAAGGAQALARNAGALAPGRLADVVVLDADHPALVGRTGDALADGWVFSGNASPVRHVMVAGRWVLRDGAHARETEIGAAFRRVMRRLAS